MDYGLIGGLAQGLKEGLGAYRDETRYQDEMARKKKKEDEERALADRAYRVQLANAGLQEDLEKGGLIRSDQWKEEQRQKEDAEGASKGLIYKRDATGNIVGATRIPGFQKEEDPLVREYKLARLADMERNRQQKEQESLAKREKEEFEKSPKGRLEKAGGDTKQKIGFIANALRASNDLRGEYEKGNTVSRFNSDTPIIGGLLSDTPADIASRRASEELGRLQSGGAIGAEEEARFRAMLPRPADDKDIAAKKLQEYRDALTAKLTAYGFSPEEMSSLGYDAKSLGLADGSIAYTDDVLNYAKKHGISPEDALKIKLERESVASKPKGKR